MPNAFEHIQIKAQRCIQAAPMILVGSGASVPFELPTMEQLANHLVETVSPKEAKERSAWLDAKLAITNGENLEQVLAKCDLTESITEQIVNTTWNLISKADSKVYQQLLIGTLDNPITRLLGRYRGTTRNFIYVLTTNYDRVIEYALLAANFRYTTGFPFGYVSSFETANEYIVDQHKRPIQTVRLLKIHGSLDWFLRDDTTIISAPFVSGLPTYLKPLIVTPGLSKYEVMHGEPFRSNLQLADNFMKRARAFLCIGFGFRDFHIEPKMRKALKEQKVPFVLITKQTTVEANHFVERYAASDYLVLEAKNGSTWARSELFPNGISIPGEHWSMEGFLNLIT